MKCHVTCPVSVIDHVASITEPCPRTRRDTGAGPVAGADPGPLRGGRAHRAPRLALGVLARLRLPPRHGSLHPRAWFLATGRFLHLYAGRPSLPRSAWALPDRPRARLPRRRNDRHRCPSRAVCAGDLRASVGLGAPARRAVAHPARTELRARASHLASPPHHQARAGDERLSRPGASPAPQIRGYVAARLSPRHSAVAVRLGLLSRALVARNRRRRTVCRGFAGEGDP